MREIFNEVRAFFCPKCGKFLFKGVIDEVEVKCPSCKSFLKVAKEGIGIKEEKPIRP